MASLSPIFLLSLPRSGSTLLQKILTVSPTVHSVSEPWILLPFGFLLKKKGLRSIYGHTTFSYALEDFLQVLERGKKDIHEAVRLFYSFICDRTKNRGDAVYFLDKTPRYYLIVDFLAETFPDAKFIFLFRNPVEVFASILTTWHNDTFYFYPNYVDVHEGPKSLAKGYAQLKDRAYCLQYECLTTKPEKTVQDLCNYLQIEYDSAMVQGYRSVHLSGRMGDPGQAVEYGAISTAPRQKWKSTLNTRYRRWFIRNYVRYLGDDVLRPFHLSVSELLGMINSMDHIRPGSVSDFLHHAKMMRTILLGEDHFKNSLRALIKGRPCQPFR